MQVNKILFNTALPILLSFFKCERLILIYINSIPLQSLWQKKKKNISCLFYIYFPFSFHIDAELVGGRKQYALF